MNLEICFLECFFTENKIQFIEYIAKFQSTTSNNIAVVCAFYALIRIDTFFESYLKRAYINTKNSNKTIISN